MAVRSNAPVYREDAAEQPPARPGEPWMSCHLGQGPHGTATLVLHGNGGRENRLVCACGQSLSAAAYTAGYRHGTTNSTGRRDLMVQHQRAVAGQCRHCGQAGCCCAMTVGS